MSGVGSLDLTRPQPIDRCAWYLRVSTPKQKLEHQRENVVGFCEQGGIIIPHEMRFEDKEKRHKSAKREDFQRLLEIVKAGKLDWIIISSFDRWGTSDVDEFFEFRRILLKSEVQLWSVVDQMNLTGITEGDYFRIVAMAIGATRYVEQMAEKNILKMIEMAKQGWAGTGNAPYGTDLVCYPLHDLTRPLFRVIRTRYMRPHQYRVLHYTTDSRVDRDVGGCIVGRHLAVAREEETERMPLRDKKGTGYRFEPSLEADRIRAVHQMFELYAAGVEFHEISRTLWDQGFKHYDKPFGYHGVESILSNPVYVGLPAWGKIGVGAYRIVQGGAPTRIRRKPSDTLVVRKDETHYIQPIKPVFPPIVPTELWQRVHDRLKGRARTNPDFGKRRTRSRTIHPLNGKLFCPDCDQPMVQGSTMPAEGGRGKKTRCFNCGTYRRTCRIQCHANSVGWDRLDAAINALLETVKDRINSFVSDPVTALQKESWAKESEFTRLLMSISEAMQSGNQEDLTDLLAPPSDPDAPILDMVFDVYNRRHARKTKELREELDGIEGELTRIGKLLLEGIPSQTVKKQLFNRMAELEARKTNIEPELVPLTARATTMIEQLTAIRRSIDSAGTAAKAKLLDSFIEKVIPHFEVKEVGKAKKRRTMLCSIEFVPRQTEDARAVLPEVMEIGAAHRDRGSWPLSARSKPGTSSIAAPARWLPRPPPAAGAAPPGCVDGTPAARRGTARHDVPG